MTPRLPIRWLKVWTPGEPNVLQYFTPAPAEWAQDFDSINAFEGDWRWDYDNGCWGVWTDVPVVDP